MGTGLLDDKLVKTGKTRKVVEKSVKTVKTAENGKTVKFQPLSRSITEKLSVLNRSFSDTKKWWFSTFFSCLFSRKGCHVGLHFLVHGVFGRWLSDRGVTRGTGPEAVLT